LQVYKFEEIKQRLV